MKARNKDIGRKKRKNPYKIDEMNRKHWASQTQNNSYCTTPVSKILNRGTEF